MEPAFVRENMRRGVTRAVRGVDEDRGVGFTEDRAEPRAALSAAALASPMESVGRDWEPCGNARGDASGVAADDRGDPAPLAPAAPPRGVADGDAPRLRGLRGLVSGDRFLATPPLGS